MKFQPPSSHGACEECVDAKVSFKACREPSMHMLGQLISFASEDSQARYEVARRYKAQLDLVGADRKLEKFLQAVSGFFASVFARPRIRYSMTKLRCPSTGFLR